MMKQRKTLVTLDQAKAWHPECILSRKADGQTEAVTIAAETVLCERMRRKSGGIYTRLDDARLREHGEFLLAFDVQMPLPARERHAWLLDAFGGGWACYASGSAPACYMAESGHGPAFLASTMANGAEGVVCRKPDSPFFEPFECYKRSETHDLLVASVDYATGSLALTTPQGEPRGNCPCRQCVPVGSIVEVASMSLTASGKLREPRFLRIRHDKMAPAF